MWKPKRCPNCGNLLEPDQADDVKKLDVIYSGKSYVLYEVYCNDCGWNGEIQEEEVDDFKDFKEW